MKTINKLELMTRIANALNWGQMKADVALPAIETIIENYTACTFNRELGHTIEDVVTKDYANELFAYLLPRYSITREERLLFKSLRKEIEYEMIVHHLPYREAIQEWFK